MVNENQKDTKNSKIPKKEKKSKEEIKAEIIWLLKQGVMGKDIAKKLGITESYVSEIKKELEEDREIETRFKSGEYDPARTRKILMNTPGVGQKMANFITQTLNEAPQLRDWQNVYSLLVTFARLNHDAATVTCNRIFSMLDGDIRSNPIVGQGTQGRFPPMGQSIIGGQGPVSSYGNAPTPYPGAVPGGPRGIGMVQGQALTANDVKKIVSETMAEYLKKKEEKTAIEKILERLEKIESGTTGQEQYVEVEEPMINPATLEPMRDRRGQIITRKKKVPVSMAATHTEQKDPVSELIRLEKARKDIFGDDDKRQKTDPVLVEILDRISSRLENTGGDDELKRELEKLRLEVEKEKIRREAEAEKARLKQELEIERIKSKANMSVDDEIAKDLKDAGIELLKEMKKDTSKTKDAARRLAIALMMPEEGDAEEWMRKKDIGDEEIEKIAENLRRVEGEINGTERKNKVIRRGGDSGKDGASDFTDAEAGEKAGRADQNGEKSSEDGREIDRDAGEERPVSGTEGTEFLREAGEEGEKREIISL